MYYKSFRFICQIPTPGAERPKRPCCTLKIIIHLPREPKGRLCQPPDVIRKETGANGYIL
nr:MAG TPA: hypothetical protein [Caudoviricetes sp.]